MVTLGDLYLPKVPILTIGKSRQRRLFGQNRPFLGLYEA